MSRQSRSDWISRFRQALLLWAAATPWIASANSVSVNLKAGLSNPIYVNSGAVTINFSTLLVYSGRRAPGGEEVANVLVYSASGDFLAELPITNAGQIFEARGGVGTVTWNNPAPQYIQISGNIVYQGYDFGSGNLPFFWFNLPKGRSVASGGDSSPGGGVTTESPAPPSPPLTPSVRSRIRAVIISGLSDPAKVIVSPNVTLTGGIVALGKAAGSSSLWSSWSQGLQVLPDYDLLTGSKIPPVTPNILDVRIVRQETVAVFTSKLQDLGK